MSNGEKLKRWREIHGGSLRAFARVVGASHATVRAWERDESVPRADRAAKIEQVTGGLVRANKWR